MPGNSKEYMKNYLHEKHAQSIVCEQCGGKYKKYFQKVHLNSKKHQKAVNPKEEKADADLQAEVLQLKAMMAEMQSQLRVLNAIQHTDR
jgi:hypothetical protein